MNCGKCGALVGTNAKFCTRCGAPVAAQERAEQPSVAGRPETPTEKVTSRRQGEAPVVQYAPLAGTTLQPVIDGLRGLFTLNALALQDIRSNVSLTVPAIVVVAAAIVATGLGGFLSYVMGYADFRELFSGDGQQLPSEGEFFLKTVVVGSLLGVVFWLVGTGVTILALRSLLKDDVRPEEVLRVAGFAAGPMTLGFFLFIPGIGFGIGLISVALLLAFTTLALHKAFDAPVEKAFLAVLPGFAAWSLLLPLFVSGDNPFGPGVFVFDWSHDWGLDVLGELEDWLYRLGS